MLSKNVSIIFLLLFFIHGCFWGNKTIADKSPQEKDVNKIKFKSYPDWVKAVIHLEGATDSKSSEDRNKLYYELQLKLQKGEITPEEYSKLLSGGSRDKRYWGTALFLEHKTKRYLITARHVLYDKTKAKRYLESEKKDAESWPKSMQKSMIKSAEERAQNQIFQIIFRVPSLDEIFKSNFKQNSPEFLMNLSAGSYDSAPYTFSDIELDIAIISLDQRDPRFADDLIKQGYKPINIDLIEDGPRDVGSDVFTVGFPSTTSNLIMPNLSASEINWASVVVSYPTFTFGKVSMLHEKLPFFLADLTIYPGNSGGPVIENNKVVGIVSAQPIFDKQRVLHAKIIKGLFIKKILDEQINKDQRF